MKKSVEKAVKRTWEGVPNRTERGVGFKRRMKKSPFGD